MSSDKHALVFLVDTLTTNASLKCASESSSGVTELHEEKKPYLFMAAKYRVIGEPTSTSQNIETT